MEKKKKENPPQSWGQEATERNGKHGANGQVNKLENVPQRPTLPLMAST